MKRVEILGIAASIAVPLAVVFLSAEIVPVPSSIALPITITAPVKTTQITGVSAPAIVQTAFNTSNLINGSITVTPLNTFSVNFSIASMASATVVGSLNVLTPGVTAWVDIFPVSDRMTTAVYNSGLVSSVMVNVPIVRDRADSYTFTLMFGTSSPTAQLSATFALEWN